MLTKIYYKWKNFKLGLFYNKINKYMYNNNSINSINNSNSRIVNSLII